MKIAVREDSVKECEAENTKMQNNLLHIKNENYEAEKMVESTPAKLLPASTELHTRGIQRS